MAILPHDNLEEFQDPANYDLEEIPRSLARIDYFARLAHQLGGPVLELACGSGIVALQVVTRTPGLRLTGVDLAEPMLHHARAKAQAAGLGGVTTWVHGDARHVRLDEGPRFRLVYLTGNAFQAFLTPADQAALLANVKRHLAPDGVFAFETRNPTGQDLRDVSDEEPWDAFTNVDGQRVTVSGLQLYDAASRLMHWTTFRRWHDGRGARESVTRIACRFTPPAELDALLRASGFVVSERLGDWDGAPFTERSEHIISLCRHAAAP